MWVTLSFWASIDDRKIIESITVTLCCNIEIIEAISIYIYIYIYISSPTTNFLPEIICDYSRMSPVRVTGLFSMDPEISARTRAILRQGLGALQG